MQAFVGQYVTMCRVARHVKKKTTYRLVKHSNCNIVTSMGVSCFHYRPCIIYTGHTVSTELEIVEDGFDLSTRNDLPSFKASNPGLV